MVIRSRKLAPKRLVAVGYVRMSTRKQDISPEVQAAELERLAAEQGAALVAVYYDPGISGTTDLDQRPALAAALAALETHRASFLIAAKWDRLARDVDIAGYIATMVRRAKASVITADASRDPLRRAVDRVMDSDEVQRIRARTRAALAVKRAKGERLGGRVPYGMMRAPDGQHVVRDGFRRCQPDCAGCLRLVACPEEQAIIARAKQLSDEGLSVRAITVELNASGGRNRLGKPFAFQAVYDFLRPLLLAIAV